MLSYNYFQIDYDSCVYHKKLSNGSHIYLLLYVNDILIAIKDLSDIDHSKS